MTDAEAERRRPPGSRRREPGSTSLARILRRNVFTILNGALFSVSIALLVLGLFADALVTAAPVATNVAVSVALEINAKRKLDHLTFITRPRVRLRRGGRERPADASELVVGDVVVLERGDQAVADGRLIEGRLELDESVLSGESEPVGRSVGDPIRSGSICVSGRGAMEATEVGTATFASKLAAEARRGSDERTPLRRDLDTLILAIGVVTVAAAAPVILALRAAGQTLFSADSVQAAAVLVALVPQGLAIMATVTYALGAVRISRAGAIVQRIDALESMSRVDVLCLDKTGTLTTHALELDRTRPLTDDPVEVESLLRASAASSSVRDRVVEAIAAALPADPRPPLAEVPFSSDRRWSAVTIDAPGRRTLVLGAPEVIAADDAPLRDLAGGWAAEGYRVLVFADAGQAPFSTEGAATLPALRPLALLGFREQLRPDARQTLGALSAAGVRSKLVSGDDPATVAAIATAVGLPDGRVLSGPAMEQMDDRQLREALRDTVVCGRTQPADKRRLVHLLREDGHYVAMTGDGVNDVLALREANLGIAMESGSGAARAIGGLTLRDDRFGILPQAIVEGQRIVASMIAVSSLLLARTVYMLILVVIGALAGLPFPFTPRNNSVLALVTVGIPTLALAVWVGPLRSPRSVVPWILRYAVPAGVLVALLGLPVLPLAFTGNEAAVGRSIMTTYTVFAGIALIPLLFPADSDRSGPVGRGGDPRPALLALAMLLLYGAIAATPLARDFFELRLIPASTVAALFVYTIVWFVVVLAVLRLGLPDRLAQRLSRHPADPPAP